MKSIGAANGVTNPAAATSSDSIDVEVDGAAPATNPLFPLNNGSYDGTTWAPPCTQGICGTVTDAGSGVGQVNVSIKDRTTGKYWGGSAFDQPTQTYNAATVVGNNWSYALAAGDLTAPHSYLIEVYSVDNVANSDVHQQIRFTYGSDVGGPASTLTLSSASHAYLTATAPYVLYYGTGNGGGGFTLHQSASDPSGVDTITFPDLSGTSGFSGNGGTATNGSSADPFVSSSSYTFTSSAGTAPAPKNVDSADLRGNLTHDQVAFVLDNSAPTGGTLSVNGGNAYSTTTSFAVSHVDYTVDGGGSGVASSVLTVASATLSNGVCGSFGAPAPAVDGVFAGAQGSCYRFTLTGTDNVGNVATTSSDVKVDTTPPTQPTITFGNLSSGNTFDDGAGTLYYRPSAGGTFRVDAASTDPESGIQRLHVLAADRLRVDEPERRLAERHLRRRQHRLWRAHRPRDEQSRPRFDRRHLPRHARLDCAERRRPDRERNGGDGNRQLELLHERRFRRTLDDALQRRRLGHAERGRHGPAGNPRERHVRELRRVVDRRRSDLQRLERQLLPLHAHGDRQGR